MISDMKSFSNFTRPLLRVVLSSILAFITMLLGCTVYKSAGSRLENAQPQASTTPSPNEPETTPCTITLTGAPVVTGLKLGMTTEEVLALFPGSKDDAEIRSQLSGPVSEFGNSSFAIRPSKYEPKDKYAGISQIALTLLDGRVYSYTVGYNGPEYSHVDNFVTKFVEGKNLPAADQWEPYVGLENQLKILKCMDLEVRVFAGGPGGSQNYIVVTDVAAVKKLKERRDKARGKPTPTPGE